MLLLATGIIAQRPLDVTEVRIVAPFEPVISEAFKINDNPEIEESTAEKPSFTYRITPRKLETKFEIEPIKPAQVASPVLSALNHGHLRVGFGSQATPYAEFFVSSNRSKNHSVGLNLRHFSCLSSIPGRAYSGFGESMANLFGNYFFGNSLLEGGIKYNHHKLYYYGFDPTDFGFAPHGQEPSEGQMELKKEDYGQYINRLEAKVGVRNKKNQAGGLIYNTGVEYRFFADRFDAKEHLVELGGKIGHQVETMIGRLQDPILTLDVTARFFNNTGNNGKYSNAIVSMTPGVLLKSGESLLFAGVDATMKVDTAETSVGIYPLVSVEASLIEQYLKVHGKLSGGLRQLSLDELTRQNPFLDTSTRLAFENTKYDISGGIKGVFNDNLAYNISFGSARIQNHPFFVTDTASQFNHKFLATYDTLTRITLRGELFSSFGTRAQARFSVSYYQYSLKNEIMPWHLPELELAFNARLKLMENIVLNADVFGRGKTFAKVYDNENNPVGQKLHDFVLDFNIGGEYRISPTISAFLQLQNFTGKSFDRWLNYPTKKLNVFGGVAWSF